MGKILLLSKLITVHCSIFDVRFNYNWKIQVRILKTLKIKGFALLLVQYDQYAV